jgi:3-oxoisoapionate decarboxylase
MRVGTMKIGIDSYCFHRFFGEVYDGQPEPDAAMTMEDFLDFAVELGVDGVSLESCFFPSMETSWFRQLKASLDDHGLERVYAWGHPQGLEDGSNHAALEDMISQIDNAVEIGAKVMRVVPGPGPGDYRYLPRQPRLDVLARWFKEAALEAASREVKLAAENHGDYTAREMLWLVEAVGSPYFGVNFDTGNFLRLLDDPLEAMEKLSQYVFATHIKDLKVRRDVPASEWFFFSSTPVGDGLIDIGQVIRLLAEASYDGLLAVEIDHLHPDYGYDEHGAVRQSIDELRSLAAPGALAPVGNAVRASD